MGSAVDKLRHGGPRGPDGSVRTTTNSRARIREDRAVVVHACNCDGWICGLMMSKNQNDDF
jgi:hypothetical protein